MAVCSFEINLWYSNHWGLFMMLFRNKKKYVIFSSHIVSQIWSSYPHRGQTSPQWARKDHSRPFFALLSHISVCKNIVLFLKSQLRLCITVLLFSCWGKLRLFFREMSLSTLSIDHWVFGNIVFSLRSDIKFLVSLSCLTSHIVAFQLFSIFYVC